MSIPKLLFCFLFFLPNLSFAQTGKQISAPTNDLDTTQYVTDSIQFLDFAEQQDGFYLFLPHNIVLDSAEIIVFVHGYGGINPMIYGKWIKHLARQGNIIIYPRYQKNLREPRPDVFALNTATAINKAQLKLQSMNIPFNTQNLTMVGHSYGGVIIADLTANANKYQVPQAQAIMLVSPGTAWLKKGRLDSYSDIPKDTKLLITVSEDDKTTRDEFGILVFETAINTPQRILYRQKAEKKDGYVITAGHNESYSLDLAFDTGLRNFTAKRALRIGKYDALDYKGYWKLLDELIACQRRDINCSVLQADSFDLGKAKDGSSIAPFSIIKP